MILQWRFKPRTFQFQTLDFLPFLNPNHYLNLYLFFRPPTWPKSVGHSDDERGRELKVKNILCLDFGVGLRQSCPRTPMRGSPRSSHCLGPDFGRIIGLPRDPRARYELWILASHILGPEGFEGARLSNPYFGALK